MGDNPKWSRSTTATRRAAKKPLKYLHVSTAEDVRVSKDEQGNVIRTVTPLPGRTYSRGV